MGDIQINSVEVPNDTNLPSVVQRLAKEEDDRSIVVSLPGEIPEDALEEAAGTIKRTPFNDRLSPVASYGVDTNEEGKKILNYMILDMEDFWKMIYEYQRYADAEGFSDSEMDVLRVIESRDQERVTTNELKNSSVLEDYSPGTIHRALNKLVDKDLIRKYERGLYGYRGP